MSGPVSDREHRSVGVSRSREQRKEGGGWKGLEAGADRELYLVLLAKFFGERGAHNDPLLNTRGPKVCLTLLTAPLCHSYLARLSAGGRDVGGFLDHCSQYRRDGDGQEANFVSDPIGSVTAAEALALRGRGDRRATPQRRGVNTPQADADPVNYNVNYCHGALRS